MVTAINSIGHVMGILTIAEFVESDEILAKLREIESILRRVAAYTALPHCPTSWHHVIRSAEVNSTLACDCMAEVGRGSRTPAQLPNFYR